MVPSAFTFGCLSFCHATETCLAMPRIHPRGKRRLLSFNDWHNFALLLSCVSRDTGFMFPLIAGIFLIEEIGIFAADSKLARLKRELCLRALAAACIPAWNYAVSGLGRCKLEAVAGDPASGGARRLWGPSAVIAPCWKNMLFCEFASQCAALKLGDRLPGYVYLSEYVDGLEPRVKLAPAKASGAGFVEAPYPCIIGNEVARRELCFCFKH